MNGQDFQLIVSRGPDPGKIISLTSASMTIGRDPMSEITINDPEVSRRHAILLSTPQGYQVQDLGSTNGTFVDGLRLGGEPVALEPGQVITIGGGVELVYEAVAEVDAQAETILETDIDLPELPQQPEPSEPDEPVDVVEPSEVIDEGSTVEAQDLYEVSLPGEDERAPSDSELAAEVEAEPAEGLEWSPPLMEEEAVFAEATTYEESASSEPEPVPSYDADDFAKPVVIPHEGQEQLAEEERPPFYRRMSTIIAALLLLILCCCCSLLLFFYYVGGDWLLRQMGLQ